MSLLASYLDQQSIRAGQRAQRVHRKPSVTLSALTPLSCNSRFRVAFLQCFTEVGPPGVTTFCVAPRNTASTGKSRCMTRPPSPDRRSGPYQNGKSQPLRVRRISPLAASLRLASAARSLSLPLVGSSSIAAMYRSQARATPFRCLRRFFRFQGETNPSKATPTINSGPRLSESIPTACTRKAVSVAANSGHGVTAQPRPNAAVVKRVSALSHLSVARPQMKVAA